MTNPTAPSSNTHPKLHNASTKTTLMFEPSENDTVVIWQAIGGSKKWEYVATMLKQYARTMWAYHVSQGAVRTQD
jgi:hypothetical protein